ncbi:hypothetical protein [Paraburkholderia strydomiana]|uniref:hypothetical protein n=1 Tax=Paraburkholderia strydomiana TaxID=1245417 RepID=UPI0038BBDA3B
MGIAALKPCLVADGSDQPAGFASVGALQRQIDSMMGSLRRIAANLRPPMLDDLGLAAALEWRWMISCTASKWRLRCTTASMTRALHRSPPARSIASCTKR